MHEGENMQISKFMQKKKIKQRNIITKSEDCKKCWKKKKHW